MWRGFGAIPQVFWENRKMGFVPPAKRVGADLLYIVVPEIAYVVSGVNFFETAAESVQKQFFRKHLASGSRKWKEPRKGTKGGREPQAYKR